MANRNSTFLQPLCLLSLGALLVLSGCRVNIDDNGVRVKGMGLEVEADQDGASVRLPGLDVNTDNESASVHIPGIDIQTGRDDAEINIDAKNMPRIDITASANERVSMDVWGEDGESYSLASNFFDPSLGAKAADKVVLPVYRNRKKIRYSWAPVQGADRYMTEIHDEKTGKLIDSQNANSTSGSLSASKTAEGTTYRLTIIAYAGRRNELARYTTFFHVGDIAVNVRENVDDGCIIFDPTHLAAIAVHGDLIPAQRGGLRVRTSE